MKGLTCRSLKVVFMEKKRDSKLCIQVIQRLHVISDLYLGSTLQFSLPMVF